MRNTILISLNSYLFVLSLLTLGCGVKAGNGPTPEQNSETENKPLEEDTSNTQQISGNVFKGPVDASTVRAYKINEDGSIGEEIGSTETDENGEYTLELDYQGDILIIAEGGTYEDEATGEVVSMTDDFKLKSIVSKDSYSDETPLTPLTSFIIEKALANKDKNIIEELEIARIEITEAFGLEGINILKTKPIDLTKAQKESNNNGYQYGLLISSFSQAIKDKELEPEDLLEYFKEIKDRYKNKKSIDIKDGKFSNIKSNIETSKGNFIANERHKAKSSEQEQTNNNTKNNENSDESNKKNSDESNKKNSDDSNKNNSNKSNGNISDKQTDKKQKENKKERG